MGVEQFYVSGLEAGKRNITIVSLWRAAIALNIEAAELVARGVHKATISPKLSDKKKR